MKETTHPMMLQHFHCIAYDVIAAGLSDEEARERNRTTGWKHGNVVEGLSDADMETVLQLVDYARSSEGVRIRTARLTNEEPP